MTKILGMDLLLQGFCIDIYVLWIKSCLKEGRGWNGKFTNPNDGWIAHYSC